MEVLLAAREQKSYSAIVDSGASTSAFPYGVALQLGIADDELEQTAEGVRGLGPNEQAIPAWKPRYITVNAQIIATTDTGAERFGPQFPLAPVFLKDSDRFMLGRADFFSFFAVSFPRTIPPRVVLQC